MSVPQKIIDVEPFRILATLTYGPDAIPVAKTTPWVTQYNMAECVSVRVLNTEHLGVTW